MNKNSTTLSSLSYLGKTFSIRKKVFIKYFKNIINSSDNIEHLKFLLTYPIFTIPINIDLIKTWINIYQKTKKTTLLRNNEKFIIIAFQEKYLLINNKQIRQIIKLMKSKKTPQKLQNEFKLHLIQNSKYELLKKQQLKLGRKSFSNCQLLANLEKYENKKLFKKFPTSNNVRFQLDIKFSDIIPIDIALELTRLCSKYISKIHIHEFLICDFNNTSIFFIEPPLLLFYQIIPSDRYRRSWTQSNDARLF